MAARGTYITTLVILVLAAFFIGLVAGVNIGSANANKEGEQTRHKPVAHNPENNNQSGVGTPEGRESERETPDKEYPDAPDFALDDLSGGEPVELANFKGSPLLLFVTEMT